MSIVIKVENLSKYYRLGLIGGGTLREDLQRWWARVRGRPDPLLKVGMEDHGNREGGEIWALRDVSFEVQQGEILGIIGRNGAGKSTLLKILSRITAPTSGRALIKGRVGSLLEVGTGFHGELTGRENIYLNGSILGMRKWEIDRKLDEIIAFSEIDKFIDTPVKRYSSGMYVRLAFAVAAHLEPEILIVDEVLAVGDVTFQRKCLGKMDNVAKRGRTVLFVSHNMASVQNLCNTCMVLNRGEINYSGTTEKAITNYLTNTTKNDITLLERKDRLGSGKIIGTAIIFKDEDGNQIETVRCGQTIDICLYFEKKQNYRVNKVLVGILISTQNDVPVFLHHNCLTNEDFGDLPNSGVFVCRINTLPLVPNTYKLTFSIMPNNGVGGEYFDSVQDAISLFVSGGDFYNSGMLPPSTHGSCLVQASWRLETIE